MAAVEFSSLSLASDANLVSYYKMENVNDSKGSNTLTNTGTVAFNAGVFNNAADFGSSNTTKNLSGAYEYVAVNTNFSIGWWFKGAKCIVSWNSSVGGGGADEFYIGIEKVTTYGQLYYHSCNSDGSEEDSCQPQTANYDDTAWCHLMFIGEKSGSDWIKKAYFNGVELATATVTGKNPGKLGTAFYIGKFAYEGTIFLNGLVDDMVIFNRALTASEVSLIYNGPTVESGSSAFFMNLLS